MDENIVFPYKPKRKIVVFGQREAWCKGIKPCLINVEIICHKNSNKKYDSIIEKADVVWVHSEMSHSFFNKINKTTKKYNKQLLYLRGRGGKNSAEQIYLFEEKGEYINYLTN